MFDRETAFVYRHLLTRVIWKPRICRCPSLSIGTICILVLMRVIVQVEGIVPWPIEVGPEFIHGAKTSLKV